MGKVHTSHFYFLFFSFPFAWELSKAAEHALHSLFLYPLRWKVDLLKNLDVPGKGKPTESFKIVKYDRIIRGIRNLPLDPLVLKSIPEEVLKPLSSFNGSSGPPYKCSSYNICWKGELNPTGFVWNTKPECFCSVSFHKCRLKGDRRTLTFGECLLYDSVTPGTVAGYEDGTWFFPFTLWIKKKTHTISFDTSQTARRIVIEIYATEPWERDSFILTWVFRKASCRWDWKPVWGIWKNRGSEVGRSFSKGVKVTGNA